ncbi:hypothetical protein HK097_006895, partial [Rhizophlyctis rosea]
NEPVGVGIGEVVAGVGREGTHTRAPTVESVGNSVLSEGGQTDVSDDATIVARPKRLVTVEEMGL